MARPGRPQRERRGAPIDPITWSFLLDERGVEDDMDLFMLTSQHGKELRELWNAVGDAVTAAFAEARPGRRPKAWWQCEAPEMRRRLGGCGTLHSGLSPASMPCFEFGLPTDWELDHWWWTRDGQTPPPEYVAFDRNDPPRFESQATFLRRHKLLLPGELRRLKAVDFQPEIVIVEAVSPADIDDPIGAAGPSGSSPLTPPSKSNDV